MKLYYQYAKDVLSGKIVAGKYMKLACERFESFLLRGDLEFREKSVEHAISFVGILKHYTGRHKGAEFILQAWQQFIVASIYGFFVKETGERLTQSVYIEIARKNGKTAFGAALCLYHLIADGENGAEVQLAANSKDQAKVAFKMCSAFTRGIDARRKILKTYRDSILLKKNESILKVIAADDSKLDGFNASMFLLDEYHAAKNSRMKDVLQSSQGMRDNPIGIIITTAGFDKLGPCYSYRGMCIEVLNGASVDDRLFIAIYSIDEDDDWKNPEVWIKSNPNLGVTVKKTYIERQIGLACNSPIEEVGVKTKTLNVWCDSLDVWIPDEYILSVTGDVDLSSFDKNDDCFVGIDLSSTTDLAAVSYMVTHKNKLYFKTDYYLPRESLKTKKLKELYGQWARSGHLKLTPGNVIDYDIILNDIMDADKKVFIQKIGYDSWNSTQFVINAEDRGLPMEPFSQSIGNFNKPTKELERSILSENVVIDNNVITRHCFRNVTMKRDWNGNTKPSKQFDDNKIDGVISMIQAYGIYLESPRYTNTL